MLKPKKHLGQHFLRDENIARKIVGCLPQTPEGDIVEIGPGMGVLTKYLVSEDKPLHVVEFDPDATEYLSREFSADQLIIHGADFLKWPLQTELKRPAHFIGNLPYNVSSPIFFRLLDNLDWVLSGTFMVQKEVAERICAGPGSKTYGILSVLLGYYFELKYQFTVSPKVFHPPPKVNSGVFTMIRKPLEGKISPSVLKPVVKAGFGKRRKTLRNALKGMEFEDFPGKTELMGKRAEQLSLASFELLAKSLIAP